MGSVGVTFSTSLDGFIAYPDDTVGHLFDWYDNGEIETRPPGHPLTFRMTEASTRHWHNQADNVGAIVSGRRVFDVANGWDGIPMLDAHTFVVTHRPPAEDWQPNPKYTFVHDGVASAITQAKAEAGDRNVSIVGADIAQQALNLSLVDIVNIDLVPMLLGKGIRYFDNIDNPSMVLDGPTVIEGNRVTHLTYRVTYR